MIKLIKRKFNSGVYYAKQYFLNLKPYFNNKFQLYKLFIVYKFIFNKRKVAIGTIFYIKGGVANHILALSKYSRIKNMTVPHSILPESLNLNIYRKWCNRFRLINNKLIHSHADTWFIQYCAEQKAAKKTKWVHTYHLPYFIDAHGPLEKWQFEMNEYLFNLANKADVKISVGKWLKNYLYNNYNIDTIYIPNGVDVEKCLKANKKIFTELYKLDNFILFASKMDYVKNPLEFVKLADLLPSEDFLMIGTDISYKTLKELFKKPLPRNLYVIGEYLSHDMVLNAIDACKVFVMTSRIEGLPTALMEAMALAKPVVASKVPGCIELVEDDSYGYLYDLGNLKELKKKTVLAMYNMEIGPKARQRILKEYDWRVIAPQIDKVYKDCLA